jgi:phenylalanyl-tRNA synthetase beta chain
VISILSALSFQPRPDGDSLVCSVPSWRSDIYREVDLIEEVARVHGYTKIPTRRKIELEVVPVDRRQKLAESIGMSLNGCGFHEAITVGFVDDSVAELFGDGDVKGRLRVTDVSRKSANLLRPTLLGSLLAVLKTNVNAKNLPCRIFEIADTFMPAGKDDTLPVEMTKLSLVCDSDMRDLRGAIEVVLRSIDSEAEIVFAPTKLPWAQVGADILVNGNAIGKAGVFAQKVRTEFDFKDLSPCGAELEFEQLLGPPAGPKRVRPIPRFPAIQRDLSIVVDEDVPWADIIDAVRSKATDELEDVRFVGIYRGKGVPSGKKSVTLSLRFRDEDGTLTHEMVDGFEAGILQGLAGSTAAQLRTI